MRASRLLLVLISAAACGSVGTSHDAGNDKGASSTGGGPGGAGAGGAAGTGGAGQDSAAGQPGNDGPTADDASGGADGADGGGGCGTVPAGLVSWWRAEGDFADSTGAAAAMSGGGNVKFGTGAIGQGFVLDGTAGSYVQAPNATPLRITGPLTIDAWVNPTTMAVGRIVDKIMAGAANGYYLDLVTNQLRLGVGADSLGSGVTVPTGAFTHVAGVYTGSALNLYMNGVLVATKATTVAAIPTNTLGLQIGADSGGATRFAGTIDEPRIFAAALTAADIQNIYQAGSLAHCACVPAPTGLVSWWRGDDNFADARGVNNGVNSGAVTFGQGAVANGFKMSGAASSFVLVADAPSLQLTGDITIEAWINPAALTAPGRIVDKIMAGQANGYLLDILTGAAAAPVPQLRLSVGNDTVLSPTTQPLVAGKFTHVAGVYQSGTGGTLSVYVNGARVAITTATGTAAPTSTLPLHIGSDSAGATRFNGVIDETRLYSRALAPEEIQAIYRAGAAARCAP